MRRALTIALTLLAAVAAATGSAQAVVVDMGQSGHYGIALIPGTASKLSSAKVPTITSSGPCSDPWLAADLGGPALPAHALCWHTGGAVLHSNETFDLAWDQYRRDWATTRRYIEQFLRDVADGSGTLNSPYAVMTQYRDPTGRAGNTSVYGGGCIDYGGTGGATCDFGNAVATGPGRSYPANGCHPSGVSHVGPSADFTNDTCLTAAQLEGELSTMIQQIGIIGRLQPNHAPLFVVQLPVGVEACLDAGGTVCSANSEATVVKAQFCSYHGQVEVGGTEVAYVVQPWTEYTGCDEPGLPIPADPNPAIDAGIRMVSPLSSGQIAAIVNPWLNGWFALDGSESSDCMPYPDPHDHATVGKSNQNPYYLRPAFNNAGLLEFDPNAPACAMNVDLLPAFVVPGPIDPGDVVAFDGSKTVSTLMVPNDGYLWSFGDGTTAVGPSVVHSYASGGTYSVTLTVTDRGGNVASLKQAITVLGPVASSPSQAPKLRANLLLMPQSLRTVLRSGVAVVLSSSEPADGIATLSIPRAAARRAHIATGRGGPVVIARGTVSGIKAGTSRLHLRLSPAVAAKLKHLRHVVLTVRIALIASGGNHTAIDVAGRY